MNVPSFDELEVVGSGHHQRSELASEAVRILTMAGIRTIVEMDVRPRLAQDIEMLLDGGAESVVLCGVGFRAKAIPNNHSQQESVPPCDVMVRMRAGVDPPGVYCISPGSWEKYGQLFLRSSVQLFPLS